jgi:hypothetical protein
MKPLAAAKARFERARLGRALDGLPRLGIAGLEARLALDPCDARTYADLAACYRLRGDQEADDCALEAYAWGTVAPPGALAEVLGGALTSAERYGRLRALETVYRPAPMAAAWASLLAGQDAEEAASVRERLAARLLGDDRLSDLPHGLRRGLARLAETVAAPLLPRLDALAAASASVSLTDELARALRSPWRTALAEHRRDRKAEDPLPPAVIEQVHWLDQATGELIAARGAAYRHAVRERLAAL